MWGDQYVPVVSEEGESRQSDLSRRRKVRHFPDDSCEEVGEGEEKRECSSCSDVGSGESGAWQTSLGVGHSGWR